MQFILEVLHNHGVFHYSKILLSLFLLKLLYILIFPILFILVLYTYIIRKRKNGTYIKYIKYYAITIVAVCFITYYYSFKEVMSKYYYVMGCIYLNNNDYDKSTVYYIKSWKADMGFRTPIYDIYDIVSFGKGNDETIDFLALSARETKDPVFLAKIGYIFEDRGQFQLAIDMFRQSYSLKTDPAIVINIVRNLIQYKQYDSAIIESNNIDLRELSMDERIELIYLNALIAFEDKRYIDSKEIISAIINGEIADEKHYILAGKIYLNINMYKEAIQYLIKGLEINERNPEIHHTLALAYLLSGNIEKSKESLRKSIYYENNNIMDYVLLVKLEMNNKDIGRLAYDNNIVIKRINGEDSFDIKKREKQTIEFEIKGVSEISNMEVGILRPYGFGIKAENLRFEKKPNTLRKETSLIGKFDVIAKRSIKSNLDRPWILNLVVFDPNRGVYSYRSFNIRVKEDETEEGRILFVLTEDHELISGLHRRLISENNGLWQDIDARLARVDLISKGFLADEIADKYGIHWSHIVDIGSSILNLKDLQGVTGRKEWTELWPDMRRFLRSAVRSGHDVQLHIHAYNIPGNRLFRQIFDEKKGRIVFQDNIVRIKNSRGTYGAWSENFGSLGIYSDSKSRIGSLFQGVKLLESEFRGIDPYYRVVFFRAGEYEFGFDRYSMRKSILAMRKNLILSGSNAFEGVPYQRSFKFFRPVGSNIYFTRNDDVRGVATSLYNTGILEIVPIPQENHKDYIRPVDNWKDIKFNYDRCITGNRVKNDIFILMEMFHVHTINSDSKWDQMDRGYGDWKKIEDHFSNLKSYCPKMEYVTVREAVKIYLDMYTPDIIALRENERQIRKGVYRYDIKLIGKEIDIDPAHPHMIIMKPPSYFAGNIKRVTILKEDKVIREYRNIRGYDDIQFEIVKKDGYSMQVFLN